MIDIQSILFKAFVEQYTNHIGLIAIAFMVGVVIFIFRHGISYEFDLTYKERRKLTENVLLFLSVICISTVGYLIIEGHIFILFGLLYFISIYFLYMVGFFDSIVEKMRKIYW